ncbi:MAG: HipA domain-containing protein, partial [Firmicutes bacterium]|nr:HipA domain-containing protein [Bacillota bacterium]
ESLRVLFPDVLRRSAYCERSELRGIPRGLASGRFIKAGVLALAGQVKFADTGALVAWLTVFDKAEKKYVLKHKDVDVIEIELNDAGEIAVIGKILNESHLPVGTAKGNGVDFAELKDWWGGRAIPASRDGIKEVLHEQGLCLPQQLLDKCLGLSLSDQYWICPQNEEIAWSKINFFYNEFSGDVGNLLFGSYKGQDVNAISLFSPDNTSDGMLKKKWKIMSGKRCLIKGGSGTFAQEAANEVLAAKICERLKIPFAPYWMIELDGERYSVCEDFVTGDTELVPAWRINRLIKKDNNTSEYEAFIGKVEEFGIKDVRRRMDMMITLDFIIANTDRHWNNFGLIRDANSLKWLSVAPIFDSGTSMWCKELSEEINPASPSIKSRPFRGTHAKQIKLVKDFSWLDLDALDGIESEYAGILTNLVKDPSKFVERANRLCAALRKRIELLRGIVSGK